MGKPKAIRDCHLYSTGTFSWLTSRKVVLGMLYQTPGVHQSSTLPPLLLCTRLTARPPLQTLTSVPCGRTSVGRATCASTSRAPTAAWTAPRAPCTGRRAPLEQRSRSRTRRRPLTVSGQPGWCGFVDLAVTPYSKSYGIAMVGTRRNVSELTEDTNQTSTYAFKVFHNL